MTNHSNRTQVMRIKGDWLINGIRDNFNRRAMLEVRIHNGKVFLAGQDRPSQPDDDNPLEITVDRDIGFGGGCLHILFCPDDDADLDRISERGGSFVVV